MASHLATRYGLTILLCLSGWLAPAAPALAQSAPGDPAAVLDEAQRLFYSGLYPESVLRTRRVLADDPGFLPAYELQTAALHFQIRRALRDVKDKKAGLAACDPCGDALAEFMVTMRAGRALALSRLTANPGDQEARFLLGKIDLNYVWLQLSTLARRTGWNEYQEARQSMDTVLLTHRDHLRARVSRAWIDYIVATRLPWGTRWLLGGGNKNRGMRIMREAAAEPTPDFYAKAEAVFGLWEMEGREGNTAAALTAARQLLEWFPGNQDVAMFVADANARRTRR